MLFSNQLLSWKLTFVISRRGQFLEKNTNRLIIMNLIFEHSFKNQKTRREFIPPCFEAKYIVHLEKAKILISSKKLGEDDFDFVYYEFPQEYECRKILSSFEESIHFIGKNQRKTVIDICDFKQTVDKPFPNHLSYGIIDTIRQVFFHVP